MLQPFLKILPKCTLSSLVWMYGSMSQWKLSSVARDFSKPLGVSIVSVIHDTITLNTEKTLQWVDFLLHGGEVETESQFKDN